jgi:hypothetical protein
MTSATAEDISADSDGRSRKALRSLVRNRNRRLAIAGWYGCMIGLLVLLGYALDFERAWRLAPALPATHPDTALCIVLLGFALSVGHRNHWVWRASARIAVAVGL